MVAQRSERRGRLRRADEQYREQPRRGRRRAALTSEQCRAVLVHLARRPKSSLGELRSSIRGLPRNSTMARLRRWRRICRRRRRRAVRLLRWLVRGAVWAIDGTWLDRPVDGVGRRALVVVELESHTTLALRSVRGERACSTIRCLELLIAQHGAPLVLKLDNGSAFISDKLARFCEAHGITLLHSPVRQPRYNGTCEVSGRWAKARALRAADARGDALHLTQEDLDHAVTFVGTMPRIDAQTRAVFRDTVAREVRLAAAERGLVLDDTLADHVRRSLYRVAVQRALQDCHILRIEGRGFRR